VLLTLAFTGWRFHVSPSSSGGSLLGGQYAAQLVHHRAVATSGDIARILITTIITIIAILITTLALIRPIVQPH